MTQALAEYSQAQIRSTAVLGILGKFREAWDAGEFKKAEAALWWCVGKLFDEDVYYEHPWAHRTAAAVLRHKRTALLGAKSSSKSATAVMFALVAWWAYYPHAQVIYMTTTLDAAMLRGWAMMTRLLENARDKYPELPGHIVRTKPPKILHGAECNDNLHGIICRPLPHDSDTIYSSIKGQHPERLQIVILDELNEFPIEGVPDAFQAAQDLPYKLWRLISCQNPSSFNDPGGTEAAPINVTWEDVVNKDLDVWKTAHGVALRFDGMRSPNIIAGKDLYPHLPSRKTVMEDLKRVEDNPMHPTFLSFTRALPSAEGSSSTVLSRPLVRAGKADQEADWTGFGDIRFYAALDPAFRSNGDEAILLIAQVGTRIDGFWQVEFQKHTKTIIPAEQEKTSHYFVSEWAQEICEKNKIPHSNLSVDISGPGAGLTSILERIWGSTHGVTYSGWPSKESVSILDSRKWSDIADRKCTEILMRLRYAIELGHVRGLFGPFDKIVQQGMSRPIEIVGAKISVSQKKSITRGKSWQDWLDSASCLIDILNSHGYKIGMGVQTAPNKRAVVREKIEKRLDSAKEAFQEVQAYAFRPERFGGEDDYSSSIDYSDPLAGFRI